MESLRPMNLDEILESGLRLEPRFLPVAREVERSKKGVRPSEMFFVCATLALLRPARILESGTASGQSTFQLARFFPDTPILSWDLDADDPLAVKARKRLAPFVHVELRYGNSMELLPSELSPGDAVLIDGPKGFRALRMAFELLGTGKTPVVFVHDFTLGLPERRFVERFCPEALFSDHPRWVWRHSRLDGREVAEQFVASSPEPASETSSTGYGPGFVCLPYVSARSAGAYRRLIFARSLWRIASLVPEKIFGRGRSASD